MSTAKVVTLGALFAVGLCAAWSAAVLALSLLAIHFGPVVLVIYAAALFAGAVGAFALIVGQK